MKSEMFPTNPVLAPMVSESFCGRLWQEHRATEEALTQLQFSLEAGNLTLFSSQFSALLRMLAIHFVCEERALFPLLSQYRPMILMEVEHDQLLKTQREVESQLSKALKSSQDLPKLIQAFEYWDQALRAHIREEDSGIFVKANEWLELEEQALVSRKLSEVAAQAEMLANPLTLLERPEPGYTVNRANVFVPKSTPRAMTSLFEVEHAQIQHLWLRAQEQLSPHWAPQHQYVVVIQGEVCFESSGVTQLLSPGSTVTVTPQCFFSLQAKTDAHLLIYKVWPRPYFLRRVC